MNKRHERVGIATKGLEFILKTGLKDARFDGGDMLIELNDGKVFFIQGFNTKESYQNARDKAENNGNKENSASKKETDTNIIQQESVPQTD